MINTASLDDLDDPAEGDREGDGDQEEGDHSEDEGGEARGLLTVYHCQCQVSGTV